MPHRIGDLVKNRTMLKRVVRFIGILAASIVIATIVVVLVEMTGLSVVATAE
jgi:hypothetical protein